MKYLFLLLMCCGPISPMVYSSGVPNLSQVDTNIYRSGQITTQEGWDTIAKLANGRRIHVIKLNFDNEGSDELAVSRGYDVHVFAIDPQGDTDAWDELKSSWRRPDESKVDAAESELAFCKLHPDSDFCLVHCTHGQDRTGYVTGKHRVKNDGWTKDRAYKEMRDHNFHWELRGLNEAWEDFNP